MPKKPIEKQEEVTAFYASRNVDVSYYPAIWHTFKVGHLMSIDLERVCRAHELSYADVLLLGAIKVDGPTQQRATDLAQLLNVSNAVLSTRIAKLESKGLLLRLPCTTDRRAEELKLTPEGNSAIDAAIADITQRANFVHCFHQLPQEDQDSLVRIMGELHNQLERGFISSPR